MRDALRQLVVSVRSGLPFDVFVGRPSLFGNPWSHLVLPNTVLVDSVEEAILRYSAYVTTCEAIMREVPRLRGLRLGCPGRCRFPLCHAAVLAQLANRPMRRAA